MNKDPLSSRVLKSVQKLGVCTVSEVVADMGHLVSASHAIVGYNNIRRGNIKAGNPGTRPTSTAKKIQIGRRHIITNILRHLTKRHAKIRRVSKGVYASLEKKK